MSVMVIYSVTLSEDDAEYILGAARERGQAWEDFAREALLSWAAR